MEKLDIKLPDKVEYYESKKDKSSDSKVGYQIQAEDHILDVEIIEGCVILTDPKATEDGKQKRYILTKDAIKRIFTSL